MVEIWIDAHLSPSLALWLNETFQGIKAQSVRALGLRDANDDIIFREARKHNAVIMTKDSDFVRLLDKFGPPPKIILITVGNTTNSRMRQILDKNFLLILDMLNQKEQLIEIDGQ